MPQAREAPSSQAVITLSSSPPAPPAPVSSDPSVILDQAVNKLSRLREDLQSADPRLVVGRLELASGWACSAASVQAALMQAASASDEEKQAARQAEAARDAAQGDVADARGCCKALEFELQDLREELAKEVRIRQEKGGCHQRPGRRAC